MDESKWRVAQMGAVATTPYGSVNTRVWAVWPPLWPREGKPLLAYPVWAQALRAAADRADFAYSPSPPTRGNTNA